MSPEILMILEADVVCVTECSIHTTVSLNLLPWNIAGSSGTRQGDMSQSGGLIPQHGANGFATLRFALPLKQGNACGGKGLTGVRWISRAHLPHPEVE